MRVLRAERDPASGRCRYVAGGVANPVFEARTGDAIDLVVENALAQPTTVHFHGLTLPESADGAGFDPIPPGASKRVRFELTNRSGLYWLHPHPHGLTAEQVYSGLVALLVVRDADDDAVDAALGLSSGNRLSLGLTDARFNASVWLPYAPSTEDRLHGWFGDRALVNGSADASYTVAPGWVRLQLLNACNARGLLIGFRDGDAPLPFHLLGTDGGLLEAPRELERAFLYGGERIDLALDLSGRSAVTAWSLEFDPRHQVHRHHPGAGLPDGAALRLFELKVSGALTKGKMPLPLSSFPRISQSDETRRIRLELDAEHGFLIDGAHYRMNEEGWRVARGARETWEVRNSPISMPHAMHLHGFGFRVLRRQATFGPARALAREANGRLATDLGVKDTVVVWPGETVSLAVDFSLPADPAFRGAQRYMFHCHNLEHEDGMMMRNVTVV